MSNYLKAGTSETLKRVFNYRENLRKEIHYRSNGRLRKDIIRHFDRGRDITTIAIMTSAPMSVVQEVVSEYKKQLLGGAK